MNDLEAKKTKMGDLVGFMYGEEERTSKVLAIRKTAFGGYEFQVKVGDNKIWMLAENCY